MAIDYRPVNEFSLNIASTLTTRLTPQEAYDIVWDIAVEMHLDGILPQVSCNVFRTNISEEISKNCPESNQEVFRLLRNYQFVPSGRAGSWRAEFDEDGSIINVPPFDQDEFERVKSISKPSKAKEKRRVKSWRSVKVAPQKEEVKEPKPLFQEVAELRDELAELKGLIRDFLIAKEDA